MQASIDFNGTLTGSIAGGGGGGSDVSITPTYNQGTKIADYSIDGNEGAIYTPEIKISKNVLSGVKICEIEGVEIYCPSYGYIDTLGDSNVEQIGGFSEGANVTPVNVKKVSYTNDVSNGEKIGALTVGDTSYNVYQKPNVNINYSLTEQDTGKKWIDGKAIFQKTYKLSSLIRITNNGTNITSYITNGSIIEKLVNACGYNDTSGADCFGALWVGKDSTNTLTAYCAESGDFNIITLWYTKTTDTAGSGEYNTKAVQ